MIKRLHSYGISEEDIRAILRQRMLLASRSPLAMPMTSNSCTVPPHLYIAWSDSSEEHVLSYENMAKRLQLASSVRIVSKQHAIAEARARVVPFEKPFPKDETPYEPTIPSVPRLIKLHK